MVRGQQFMLAILACCSLLTGCRPEVNDAKKPDAKNPVETPKADDVPIPLDKWDRAAVEKTFGLRFKSVSFNRPFYTFVVEFTKDLTPAELKEVQAAFPFTGPDVKSASKVYVRFMDKDNVQLEKSPYWTVLTELTGKKGEAFRLVTSAPANATDAVRAEIRLPDEAKPKDKEDR